MSRPPGMPLDEPPPQMLKVVAATPGRPAESMWFERIGPGTAELRNIPAAATWLVFGDLVLLDESGDTAAVAAILHRTHATVLVAPDSLDEARRVWDALRAVGATTQRLDDGPCFVAAVPLDRLAEAESLLDALGIDAEVQPAERPPEGVAVRWLQ
jgi:Domain of unknown function (DUF4265)